MRKRYRYDEKADMFYEVGSNYFDERKEGPAVISDDVGAGVNGLRHMPSGQYFDSKSRHRAENRARGLEEVGNETNFASAPTVARMTPEHVHIAKQQIEGNYNGTRDWLRHRDETRSGEWRK